MQAHLKDLAGTRHDSESFHICQRVLNQCHEMIYGDLPASGTPYTSLSLLTLPGFIRKKIKPNVQPALVGIGTILAGVPGMPPLTQIMGEVAIEQGRLDDLGEDLRSLENPDGIVRTASNPGEDRDVDEDEDGSDPESESRPTGTAPAITIGKPPMSAARLRGESRKGGTRSRSQTIAAQTSPALPLHLKDIRKPRLSEDPFGQNDPLPSAILASPSPFQSTPTISASRHFRKPNSFNQAELLLQKYDSATQQFLLRCHFCRSEVGAYTSNHVHSLTRYTRCNSCLPWRTSATSFWWYRSPLE